ncbi:MAG: DUF998 domain-containing protein [Thermoplasmata archaeon]
MPSSDVSARRDREPLPRPSAVALALTVVLIGVYVVLDIIVQLLPPHYSAITQAESDLAVGPYGFVMTANFVVRGILSLTFVYGLTKATALGRRTPLGVGLLATWGVGAFILAASPTDVGSGSPTLHGLIHLVVAAIAFLAGAIGELLLSRNFRTEGRLAAFYDPALLLAVIATIVCLVTFAATGAPRFVLGAYGLVERIFLGLILLWMLLVALFLLRENPQPAPGDHRTTRA